MSTDFKYIYEQIVSDPRYLANIQYGKPRKGHAEGSVAAHIVDLEQNLLALVQTGLVDDERHWKLKALIHVHDSFKAEAKRDSAILGPQSHASLARAYLAQFTYDFDMLQITQFHDIGYALYKKQEATGRFDEQRFLAAIMPVQDIDLFLMFTIIDACTPSKGRKVIRWFVEEVGKRRPDATIRAEHILPGPELTPGGSW